MGESEEAITLRILFIAMIMLFVLALSVIVFFIIYQKRLLGQQKKHQQLESDYQKDLLKTAIQSEENERVRIGKELHDDVGALLTTTKLYLNQISADISTEELEGTTNKMRSLFDMMIMSVRNISQDLRPVILEKLGIIEAVESLVQTLNDSGEIQVSFTDSTIHRIDASKELNIYRIIQELINNTLKHAQASQISIAFLNEGNQLIINYEDNGIGLQTEKLKHKKGIGLKNIESRLSVLSGTINFKNQQSGTRIEISIPS